MASMSSSSYGTPKDLIERTIRFEKTKTVPYWLSPGSGDPHDSELYKRLNNHYGNEDWQEGVVDYFFGAHYVSGAQLTVDLPNGHKRNAFGAVYEQNEKISHVVHHPIEKPTLQGYTWPKAEDLADWEALGATYNRMEGSFRLCGMSYGLYERAWEVRGMEPLLMDMIDSPGFVDDLMNSYADLKIEAIDLIHRNVPCEGIFGGGDDCDQRGPIMGLERWRRFIKSPLKRIVDHTHSLGKPYVAHLCGNIMPMVDDLMEIGVDAFESLQAEAMDVYELKRRTYGKTWLIGGLGVQSTMHFGSPDDVRREAERLKRELGRGGGYVLATCKPVMTDAPTENIIAYVEAAV